jgi:arylsulfatase A-like enzyme
MPLAMRPLLPVPHAMPRKRRRAAVAAADEIDRERREFLHHLKWVALTSGLLGGCGGGSGGGSGSSSSPPPQGPNILAIVIDDLNDWCGFLGGNSQARTPNIDALAARSTAFLRNYCSAPLCNPSRCSLWSGLSVQNTGVYDNNTSLQTVTPQAVLLPDYLAEHGYAAALHGKVYHTYDMVQEPFPGRIPDRNLVCSGYPTMVTEGLFDWGGMDVDDDQMPDWIYTQNGIDFLQGASTGRPFFLGVGMVRTHVAWYVPQKWIDMFPLADVKIPDVPANDLDDIPPEGRALALTFGFYDCIADQGRWAEAVQAYLASIAFVDSQVGRLMAALDASPHADNTIVVLFSDNGFHLGQKFHWHKQALWEQTTRVPLIVRTPGQATGATVDAAVSLVDLFPTLMELTGLPGPYPLDGTSLAPLLAEPATPWDHPVLMTNATTDAAGDSTGVIDYAIRSNLYRYIQYHAGGRELYLEGGDPGEFSNVAADPQYAGILADLSAYVPG